MKSPNIESYQYLEAARTFCRKTEFNNVKLIEQAMREGAKLATQPATIEATPGHNVGKQTMSFRMASNAIWNKCNFALSLIGFVNSQGQLRELVEEARELADSIVKHPASGDLS